MAGVRRLLPPSGTSSWSGRHDDTAAVRRRRVAGGRRDNIINGADTAEGSMATEGVAEGGVGADPTDRAETTGRATTLGMFARWARCYRSSRPSRPSRPSRVTWHGLRTVASRHAVVSVSERTPPNGDHEPRATTRHTPSSRPGWGFGRSRARARARVRASSGRADEAARALSIERSARSDLSRLAERVEDTDSFHRKNKKGGLGGGKTAALRGAKPPARFDDAFDDASEVTTRNDVARTSGRDPLPSSSQRRKRNCSTARRRRCASGGRDSTNSSTRCDEV